jgi:hypothetical protein
MSLQPSTYRFPASTPQPSFSVAPPLVKPAFHVAGPKVSSTFSSGPSTHSGGPSVAVLADSFYKATLGKRGRDEETVKKVLKTVYQQGRRFEFEQAVLQLARAQGNAVTGVEAILQQELAGNAFDKFVLKAPLTECQDLWRHGQETYRATPWDYRVRGMWGALQHFAHVIKSHPVISLGAMGGLTAIGHFRPVIGAVSGTAIMGISALSSINNEVKAFKHPLTDLEKVGYYQKSGENLTAFLLTLVSAEGIYKSLTAGYKAGVEAARLASTLPNAGLKKPYQIWKGLMHQAGEHEKMDYRQFGMFVLGLLDDSLLPFNWVSEKLQKSKASQNTH